MQVLLAKKEVNCFGVVGKWQLNRQTIVNSRFDLHFSIVQNKVASGKRDELFQKAIERFTEESLNNGGG